MLYLFLCGVAACVFVFVCVFASFTLFAHFIRNMGRKFCNEVLKNFLFYIEVQLIYNAVLVSHVQQSNSVIHIHISILFQILFPFRC